MAIAESTRHRRVSPTAASGPQRAALTRSYVALYESHGSSLNVVGNHMNLAIQNGVKCYQGD